MKGVQELNTQIDAYDGNTISIPVTFTFRELYETFTSEQVYIGDKETGTISIPLILKFLQIGMDCI